MLASCLRKNCSKTTVVLCSLHVLCLIEFSASRAYTHTLSDLETQPSNEGFTITDHNKRPRCKFTRCIHIQSNVMIHIKYIHNIPDFSVPGLLLRSPRPGQPYTPHLSLLPPVPSILDHSGRIPIPIQSPTSNPSGPNPHQMLT